MIKVIFMGTPSPVVPVLHRLHDMQDVEVVAAITPPDRPRGRGRQPEAPPVKQAAETLGIPVLQPTNLRGESTHVELAALAPDVAVVAAYGKLLPQAVLALPPNGCLNLHPSLLPRHRGPSPVATAILEGDTVTGVSLMLLDEGMDTGPVIAQQDHGLTGNENAGELTDTLFALGAVLLAESLAPWANGHLMARAQDGSAATISRKLERGDGQVDWSLPAETLDRQCRAFAPWPSLYTEWQGKMVKLLETGPLPTNASDGISPGRVVADADGAGLSVATGRGMLLLRRLQMEGRRAVSGDEFLRGYPEFVGSILGSRD